MTERRLRWTKSSYSGAPSDDCVEIARLPGGRVAVRDSKSADSICRFTRTSWKRFISEGLVSRSGR